MRVRIANSEDPDQTASSEAAWSWFVLFVEKACVGNFRTSTIYKVKQHFISHTKSRFLLFLPM